MRTLLEEKAGFAIVFMARMLEELGKAGWVVSRKTVAKSIEESGIAGISPRSYVTTTVRDGSDSYPADLVKRRSDRNGI